MQLRQGRHKAIASLQYQGKLVPLGHYREDPRAYATMIAAVGAMFEQEARAAGYEPSAQLTDAVAEMAMDEYGWGLTPDEWAIFLRDFFSGRITELYGLRRDALGRALVLWLQEWRPLVYEEVDALREEEAARHLPQLTDAEVEENQRRIRLAIEKLRQQLDVS